MKGFAVELEDEKVILLKKLFGVKTDGQLRTVLQRIIDQLANQYKEKDGN